MKFIGSMIVGLAMLLVAGPVRSQPAPRGSEQEVVARVGEDDLITFSELHEYVADRPYYAYRPDRVAAYREALDAMINARLKRIDLFASGLARDSALLRGLARNVTEELVLAYGKTQYEDRYLNEATIRAEYEAMDRVVFYRQILLNKPPDAPSAVLDSLRATVERIQRQVEDGVSLATLARRYIEDDAQAYLEGTTRVTWQETRGNPHAYILFHLSPGEVRSFEGPSSFSVARVERVEQTPVPPLEEVRDEIVSALHGRHAEKATRAFRREWTDLVDTTALRWNADALEQVVAWSNTPGFYEGDYRATVSQYLSEHDDAQILTDGRGEVRLSDLPRLFDEVLTLEASGGHDVAFMKDFFLEAVRTKRLADRARAMGLEDKVWRADTSSPVLANAFVRFYNQKRIEDRIPEPTEAALRGFYEAHDDSLFYQRARVNTEIIVRSDEDEIKALWDEVQQGVPFEEVSHRRLIRSFVRTREGEIITPFDREPPYLGEVAFGLKEGEVAGPVAYDDAEEGRLYAIVRATGRLEERQLAFDEVRDRVAKAFVEHHRDRIAADVAAGLRAHYPVTIHRDVLDRVLTASR